MTGNVSFWAAWASPTQLLPLLAAFLGGIAVTLFYTLIRPIIWSTSSRASVASIVLASGVLAGAALREISLTKATLIIVIGSLALFTFVRLSEMMDEGSETIELQSNWGGLGGGLGGWHISPATGLLLLALVLTGGVVAIGASGKFGNAIVQTGKPQTKAATGNERKAPDTAAPDKATGAKPDDASGGQPKKPPE